MHQLRHALGALALLGIAWSATAQTPSVPAGQAPAAPAPATQAPATQAPSAATAPAAQGEILEQILVKVNGEIITKTDLETRQLSMLRSRRQQLSDAELQKALNEITPELLVDAVDEMLLLQRGKELGYKLTEDQYKRVLENIRKENKLETDEALQAALKQEGMTMADLRRQLERQMIVNQVQQVEVMSHIATNEEEAKRYYAEHRAEFTTPAMITLRELVVTVQTDGKVLNVGLDNAAKAKCEAALARARAGEPFEKLVAEFSDSPSKTNGGLVPPVSVNDVSGDIKKLLEPLKVGGVTDAFRTPKGWALLKLDSQTTPTVMAYEQAREQIADKVYSTRRRTELDKDPVRLRAQAIIEWKNQDMHRIYDAKLVELAKPPQPKL